MISFLRVRVNCHEWEDCNLIKNKLFELLKGIKNYKFKEYSGRGLVSSKIIVYEVEIKKRDEIIKFFKNMIEKVKSINNLFENIKFDERFSIYLRIDKTEFITEDKIIFKHTDDSFHIKISFDMHKKDKEKVLEELKKILSTINKKQ